MYKINFIKKSLISIIVMSSVNVIVSLKFEQVLSDLLSLQSTNFQNLNINKKNDINITHVRRKRSVLQLADMVHCVTRCEPTSYLEYGCFCGISGIGSPVDPIDKFVNLSN